MTIDADIHERSAQAVAKCWPGSELTALHSLTGHSGLTLRGDLTGGSGPERVVLKLCPAGREPKGRHDVVRQAALLSDLARAGGVPVPVVLSVDAEPPPVVILSWEPGEAAEPILDMEAGTHPADQLQQRFIGAARTLARLHAVDPEGLSSTIGLEPSAPVNELRRWEPTMATVEPDLRVGAEALLAALIDQAPGPSRPSIVHGDYRLGNILCDDRTVTGVIDWEIWSVGDARIDLGWFRIMSCPGDLPGISTPMSGVVPPDDLLRAYEETAGHEVGDMTWFDAATRYKMAAIMGNNLRRHRTGRRNDPYQERLVEAIPALIRSGTDLIGAGATT
jgi:aminoglycoside phosphotransferase (APT) family kinase protein